MKLAIYKSTKISIKSEKYLVYLQDQTWTQKTAKKSADLVHL